MRTKRYYKNHYGESVKNEKQERYYKRIESMLKKGFYNCYFLTFTFSEKTLKNTSAKTRLRYIKEFLNKQASEYVLNCDYGTKNEREHYHAFILSRYKIILFSEYKNGFLKVRKAHDTLNKSLTERTRPSAENLTRHAFKETTRESKIIYSRESKPKRAITIKANKKLRNYRNSAEGIANKEFYIQREQKLKEYYEQQEKDRQEYERDFLEIA